MRNIRVLMVDDNPDFREAAERFLASVPGVKIVGCVGSAQEGIAQIQALAPELVLMDLAMPEMTGIEATRQIKKMADAPRVVILTLHDIPQYRAEAQDSGADAILDKVEFVVGFPTLLKKLFSRPVSHEDPASNSHPR